MPALRILSTRVVLFVPLLAHASVALFLEEPFGTFGGMNPTGHASIYLSNVCAASLTSLRSCHSGEQGVVISRYDKVGGFDWLAVPLIPYLYAVDRTSEIPSVMNPRREAELRDRYRRRHLEQVAPDGPGGATPDGYWIQLIGAAYDRTIYSFEIATTPEQDERFITAFNVRSNRSRFNLFFHNCSDFARVVVDSYYPHAIHRSFTADLGIMTPKQAAKCLLRYSRHHPRLEFSTYTIPQVSGTIPRSRPVRGVLESLVTSKRYIVPLAPLAIVQPYFGGALALAWLGTSRFHPGRIARNPDPLALEMPAEHSRPNHISRSTSSLDYDLTLP